MYDPSESRASRVFRWVFWILVTVGFVLYGLASNPDALWGALKFGFIWCGGIALVHFMIVQPIQTQIRSLEYKIDDMRRRLDGQRL
jgi:hypothetical protein